MTSKTPGRVSALLCAIVLVAAGCGRLAASARHDDSPPPNVKGAPMEPMPTTRQQAQDAVYRYYQKTLRELPEGYALDNSRYGSVGAGVTPCDDLGSENNNNDPALFHDGRIILAPAGTDGSALTVKIGEIWKSWGWRVEERKGFNKPNRFGTAPDGYELKVESDSTYPVIFEGFSPCFKGDQSRFVPIPVPITITRDDMVYREPSATPTR